MRWSSSDGVMVVGRRVMFVKRHLAAGQVDLILSRDRETDRCVGHALGQGGTNSCRSPTATCVPSRARRANDCIKTRGLELLVVRSDLFLASRVTVARFVPQGVQRGTSCAHPHDGLSDRSNCERGRMDAFRHGVIVTRKCKRRRGSTVMTPTANATTRSLDRKSPSPFQSPCPAGLPTRSARSHISAAWRLRVRMRIRVLEGLVATSTQ